MRVSPLGSCVALLLAAACGTVSRRAWIENGRRIGTIETHPRGTECEFHYLDEQGRLCRVDRRDREEQLLPGPCVTTFEYDQQGRCTATWTRDGALRPCRNNDGYAVVRWTHTRDANGGAVTEQAYYDERGVAARVPDGYARLRTSAGRDPRGCEREQFLDEGGQPIAATWRGRRGVAEIRYHMVDGVGEVRFAVLHGLDGGILERVQLDGRTSVVDVTETRNPNYYRAPYYVDSRHRRR